MQILIKDNDLNDFKSVLINSGLSLNTAETYFSRVKNFALYANGKELSDSVVRDFANSCNSEQTKKLSYNAIIKFYKLNEIDIKLNHSDIKIKVNRDQLKTLSANQLNDIWESIDLEKDDFIRARNKAIISVLLNTGARINECLMIDVFDVDFDNETILLKHGKGGTKRTIPMNQNLANDLKSYFKLRLISDSECDALFLTCGLNHNCERLVYGSFRNLIRSILSKAGSDLRPYIFRKTFATNLYKTGLSMEYIRLLMGHVEGGDMMSFYLDSDLLNNALSCKQAVSLI